MKISHLFNSLPKRLFAGFLLFLAVMLPVATSAASTVKIEGSMGVANVTKGDTQYAHSVNATYNQVVKLQVYYHNTELPDSGKIAQNLRVKINLPSQPGKVQTQTATISADNSNTVTDSTTVNLDDASEYLQYIPGSAVWRHNVGTNDNIKEVNTTVSDNIVTSGNGLVLENEKPCYNFSGTVTVEARVMMPGVSINKEVRVHGSGSAWSKQITAQPGATVDYLISYKNTGNSTENDVVIGDKLPAGVTYLSGTTYLASDTNPNGQKMPDGVTTSGIVIGTYKPGANGLVAFEAKLPTEDKLQCGANLLRNTASAQPKGMNYYWNTADVTVNKTCQPKPPTPAYSCDLLTLSKADNRTVKASVTYTATNGATYKSTSFAWGDTQSTSGTATSASHSYAKDGTYNVVATVSFTVNGQVVTSTNNCKGAVSFTTTPPQTPVYSCDLLSISQNGRMVTASVAYAAENGAKLKMVTLDWGDHSTPLVTNNTTASYTYPAAAGNGPFTVTARALFNVNGKDVYAADNAACAKQVSFTTTPPSCVPGQSPECTPPPVLPNTGAGNVIGIFAGVVALSSIGYRLILGRTLARR